MSVDSSSEELTINLAKIAEKYQLILQDLFAKQSLEKNNIIDPFNIGGALAEFTSHIMSDPKALMDHNIDFTHNYLELINNTISKFMGNETEPLYTPSNKDNRFKDVAWSDNIYFDFLKQSYLMTAEWMQKLVRDIKDIDDKSSKKLNFYTKQFIDAICPSNFAITNPQVLKEIIESKGKSLLKGLEKFHEDIKRSPRILDIQTTDLEAFEIGINIAVTKGKVIYKNDLMELIHYTPTQSKNYQTPILIIPPWINKFYVLDLSLIHI